MVYFWIIVLCVCVCVCVCVYARTCARIYSGVCLSAAVFHKISSYINIDKLQVSNFAADKNCFSTTWQSFLYNFNKIQAKFTWCFAKV